MNFESEEGKGTTFNVFLPITDKKRAEISPIISKKYMFSGKVLLMDDEKYVRNTLKQMLERLGFDVDTTKRGEETIKIYNEKMKQGIPYNLVIMDLTIPSGMGGKETMQYLKEINPEVLAIVSSGYSNDPIMGHPEEFGFADVLIKPYSLNKLRNLLSKYLKQ